MSNGGSYEPAERVQLKKLSRDAPNNGKDRTTPFK